MIRQTIRIATLSCVLAVAAWPAYAQDSTQKGVHIGLTYQPGTKPGVVVLPVGGAWGDSVQAIIARDLDFSDRIEIIGQPGTSAALAVQQASDSGRNVGSGLWKTLGAAAVVQANMTPTGVHFVLQDVAAGRQAQAADAALPTPQGSAAWRLAVHQVSDEIERWITGTRGIAATRVLYVNDSRIYLIDSDGADVRAITSGATALSPAWDSDGRHIAYSQFDEQGTRVMVGDLVTGQARTLATGGLNITPTFSPDGKSIVYAHGKENGTDLMLADPFSNRPATQITVGRGTDNVSPSFSPDGRRIAFTSGRAGHPEVYVVDADGSNAELLTPFNFGDQNYRSNPDWSPDGRQVAFQSRINGEFQIMTITLRDRSVKQLTSEGRNEDPSWAPDGRHLVFTSTRTGAKELFVLDVESGRVRQLTHSGGSRLAAWSPMLGRAP
ncbi:MAG TPA: LpqB family beta-propeller domain-containing protein [Gemmatimonadaceae bacterium]|nr:LpqB family beta-propeller domain-containing protein [Gemmatimonadaceae bacterium]